ncbi:hypothetical protein BUALT_Bualt03G0229300 [Buddleja alternifolia]|uniref:DDE Tnp4 domain-containing protein n=1 Tax=Buddleja alternifolia TaxID=168488 RepID=A0AAV6XY78_9LAMI|nr:hypothetical protein BUALT_Bualt03G0229300 [Buddleja alternifolia]
MIVEEIMFQSFFAITFVIRLILDGRSGWTVSVHFHAVLTVVLKLHPLLLVTPTPICDDCTDIRWKNFKGCLGALDGTYIDVQVRLVEKPKYRTRKGNISINVLGVVDRNAKFVYMLSGWEGSTTDSRVLRGLRVPFGNYYLCDNGYTNSDGFLAPYRATRYHLNDFGVGRSRPQNKKELFNLRHLRARNVIERSWGMMK